MISRSGSFSGLGLNLRTLLCAGRVGVRTGVFSRSSGSATGRPLASAKTSTPFLLLGDPLIPVFLGDEDRGGGIETPRSDFCVDRTWVGVRSVPAASLKSARKQYVRWGDERQLIARKEDMIQYNNMRFRDSVLVVLPHTVHAGHCLRDIQRTILTGPIDPICLMTERRRLVWRGEQAGHLLQSILVEATLWQCDSSSPAAKLAHILCDTDY